MDGATRGGRPRRLLAQVFVIASVTTAVLSLDATVVLLTPVVFATAARLDVRARPHVYACTHLANSASLLLPVSNLTNLLAFAASGLAFGHFAALMALPWLAVIGLEYLVFSRFFASDLNAGDPRRDRDGAGRDRADPERDSGLPVFIERLLCFCEFAHAVEHMAQPHIQIKGRCRHPRVACDRVTQDCCSVGRPVSTIQKVGETESIVQLIWLEFHDLAGLLDGFIDLHLLLEHGAQETAQRDVIRVQCRSLTQYRLGLLSVSLPGQQHRQAAIQVGIARRKLRCAASCCDRLIKPVLPFEHDAEHVVRTHHVVAEGDGAQQRRFGLIHRVGTEQQLRFPDGPAGALRVQLSATPRCGDCTVEITQPFQRDTQMLMRRRVVR